MKRFGKDIIREAKRKSKEAQEARRHCNEYEANESLKKTYFSNKKLCELIASMPRDEAVIVLNEILNADNFVSVFECAINSSNKLDNLRKSKAAKAERRKAKNAQETQSEQTDILQVAEPAISSEANNAEEALTQSEQAELSEQNTQSDPFTHTAEPTTDFSQKWDQVTSQEQTEPPAYPGSIY